MARSHVVVSARVVCYINGKAYAQVSDFQFNSSTPHKAIYGIDSATPYELAPTQTKVSGQIGLYRIESDGGAEGAGIVPPQAYIQKGKYFTIMLVDRLTDSTLFRADQCVANGQNWNIPNKGIVTGSLQFEGMIWSNEVGPPLR